MVAIEVESPARGAEQRTIETECPARGADRPTATGPASLLAGLRAAVAVLAAGAPATAAHEWGHGEREGVITALDAVIKDVTLYRGTVLLAHRQDGRWGSARDRDYADWRARTTGAGRGAALGELQVAEGLQAMPEVATAVAAGDLTLEHAKALARLRAGASDEVKKALDAGMAADLATKGKDLTAPELAKTAKKAAATIDARAAQDSFEATWRRRSVTTARTGGARTGAWVLDEVSGTIVATALDAVAGAPAADDDRTRAQRLADALVTMASRTLQVGSDLNGAQIRPHLALITDQETWAAARRHHHAVEDATAAAVEAVHGNGAAFGLDADGRPRTTIIVETTSARAATDGAGGGPGGCGRTGGTGRRPAPGLPALPAVAPAELEDGTLVPLGELVRLMCDCEMTRVVMDADSQVLDVGATQRTYAKEIRRAVTTRDRHCQWPACRIRASWSEVHHIVWYSRGGPTSVANGITACTYHHHVIHRDHIRIVPLADGFAFYRSDGSLVGTTKRDGRPGRGRSSRVPDSGGPPGLPADDLFPARHAGHEELVAAGQQIAATDGRPPKELIERHTAPPGRDTAPALPGASGPPGRIKDRGAAAATSPPRGHPARGPARGRDREAAARSRAPGRSADPARRAHPEAVTLWEASLLDQPAEPPF